MLQSERLLLRAPEPDDIDFLYDQENDNNLWLVGEVNQPLSRFTLAHYLKNAHQPFAEAGQLRMMICLKNKEIIGSIDLFEHDAKNQRAGVGIALLENYRKQGLGAEALETLKTYAADVLGLHQLYCHVQENNAASLALFKKCNFKTVGLLRDWVRQHKKFIPVYLLQCVL